MMRRDLFSCCCLLFLLNIWSLLLILQIILFACGFFRAAAGLCGEREEGGVAWGGGCGRKLLLIAFSCANSAIIDFWVQYLQLSPSFGFKHNNNFINNNNNIWSLACPFPHAPSFGLIELCAPVDDSNWIWGQKISNNVSYIGICCNYMKLASIELTFRWKWEDTKLYSGESIY